MCTNPRKIINRFHHIGKMTEFLRLMRACDNDGGAAGSTGGYCAGRRVNGRRGLFKDIRFRLAFVYSSGV